jgi:hypothetical protein
MADPQTELDAPTAMPSNAFMSPAMVSEAEYDEIEQYIELTINDQPFPI